MLKVQKEGLRVAWCVQGGLGDALQAMPFIQRFNDSFSPDRLAFYKDDARLETVGRIIVDCIPGQQGPYREGDLDQDMAAGMYDLRIDIRRVCKYTVLNPVKIKTNYPELWRQIEVARKRLDPLTFVFDHHAFYDGLFGRLMADYGMNVVESLVYYGGFGDARWDTPTLAVSEHTRERVRRFALQPGGYIIVHDGFDVFNALAGTGQRPTRAWPRSYWEALVKKLKAARPDLQIVQLGAAESSEFFDGTDHYLLGATTLEEAICLIEGAALHIDTEGGFVPCAWALKTPAISIQGPTGSTFYRYDGVVQLFDTECHGCWWSTPDWMAQCPRGLGRAECMFRVTPEIVLAKALDLLSADAPPATTGISTREVKRWGDTVWGVSKALPPLELAAGQLHSVFWRGREAARERSERLGKTPELTGPLGEPEPPRPLLTHMQFLSLMALDGTDFVTAAYRKFLKREPDASGLDRYGAGLITGEFDKIALMKIMLSSDEAKGELRLPSRQDADMAFMVAATELSGGNNQGHQYSGLLQNEDYGHDLFIKSLSLRWGLQPRREFDRALQGALLDPGSDSRTKAAGSDQKAAGGLRVAVFMVGSLGDMLQQVPFINRFSEEFQPSVLDLYFYPGKQGPGAFAMDCVANAQGPFSSEELDENCKNGQYDLRIDMKHIVKYHVLNGENIRSIRPSLLSVVMDAERRVAPYQFMLDHHPIFDGLFGRLMAKHGMNAVKATGFLGGLSLARTASPHIPINRSAHDVIERFQLKRERYLVFHDGFDADHYMVGAAKRPTKNWPLPHWERLVQLIKSARDDLQIVQIGHTASSNPLRGIDVDLIGKTTLSELVSVLSDAALVVTTEGGILRMAWALGVPTISLQGPSGSEFFQFGDTSSVISNVCNGCWFVLDEWMARCYRGFGDPPCMSGIRPEAVATELLSRVRAIESR